jgi:predicted dinucleotide-binding enzyme
MRIGVLGTGIVGRTLASKLVELGHEVRMGSRQAGNEAAVEWAQAAGAGDGDGDGDASQGTFAAAAAFGELVINATGGRVSLEALEMAGAENLAGKVLVDVANSLQFGDGPPVVGVAPDDSLGERIQAAFPDAKVVKTLNTMNASLMVAPGSLGESTNVFVCGDDAEAKAAVIELLETFGWLSGDIVDLGDISAARGAELYVALWVRLMGALDTPAFNIKIVRDGARGA